jgi:dienelactone hydrolase
MTKVFLTIAVLVLSAAEMRPAAAQILPNLPVETYVSGGTTIHVEVATATGIGVHPTVILLYGENGELGLVPWNYPYIGTWFASQGFNCFIVHYLDKSLPLTTITVTNQFLQVINDGTTWVMSQPGVNPAKIAIMGVSLGAGLGVEESARDFRIKGLAAWYGDQLTWFDNATHYTITHMPPTVMVHGAQDPVSPVATAYALQTLLQGLRVPSQLYVYPDEKHIFNSTDQQAALVQTLAFFKSYMGG